MGQDASNRAIKHDRPSSVLFEDNDVQTLYSARLNSVQKLNSCYFRRTSVSTLVKSCVPVKVHFCVCVEHLCSKRTQVQVIYDVAAITS